MKDKQKVSSSTEKISKFLSYVLRHQPEAIGIKLDSEGWVEIATLIIQANKQGYHLNKQLIEEVVATNDKKRFTLSDDGLNIRAAQGHSTAQVQIDYSPQTPPEWLYHGTATRFMDSIRSQGLVAGNRHYVHLSADEKTALMVGKRHGKPVVLKIRAHDMYQQGMAFYLADNGVWLTKQVPVEYIIEPNQALINQSLIN